MIRPARAEDIPALRQLEVVAGEAFAHIGMAAVADDEALPTDEMLVYQRAGRAWVTTDDADRPIAYLLALWVDGVVHIEQVSVDPVHAGHGLGAALIEHVAGWARAHGSPALTLTTFTEVAWNGPYYQRLGFRPLTDDELTPGLRAIRAEEATHGLDEWPRMAMRRDLPSSAPAD